MDDGPRILLEEVFSPAAAAAAAATSPSRQFPSDTFRLLSLSAALLSGSVAANAAAAFG